MISITEFNQSLALALGPITLISGVGLLMMCMTNRYNHATNRIRQLMAKRHTIPGSPMIPIIDREIDLLFIRASLLRRGMLSVALSALVAAILVAVSVSSSFLGVNLSVPESILLVICVLLIVFSALFFSQEISVSLRALELAVKNIPDGSKKE
ncbi:DUF2721 domain-containing protein [Sutterella sp.]|uniref:DUF2721 domain-containing protein n=1 Tax=Sutterella sp. TaxID=1981025 RepID=UPI0026E00DF5|nr:DUF2721 domain-containing protein [Sutterella sp.]MDO5530671.1 DUF2721 domain-containing protein [Sutterella sp.]